MQIFVSCAEILGKILLENIQICDKIFSPYLNAEQIKDVVKHIADRINSDFKRQEVVFLVVLNGAFMFAADLLRYIILPVKVSFIKIATYEGVSSTGKVNVLIGLQEKLENNVVLIIEDIVDTGFTLKVIMDRLKELNPKSIKTAALLFKSESYKMGVEPDYIGFRIPRRFVVGYGLDYCGFGRNLPGLYMIQNK